MGDKMPYMVQKGPIWQFFDDWFSDPAVQDRLDHKIDALVAVNSTVDFLTAAPAPSTTTNAEGLPENRPGHPATDNTPAEPMPDGHFAHWFDPEAGAFDDCQDFGSWDNPTATPWWMGWAGNAQNIVREAFIRALEVSLGLDHVGWLLDDAADPPDESAIASAYGLGSAEVRQPASYTRNWAIEFWWMCPVPWFQASVTWRSIPSLPAVTSADSSTTDGLVTTTFLTPGTDGGGLVSDLLDDPQDSTATKSEPMSSKAHRGSWISGHRYTETGMRGLSQAGPLGEILARIIVPTKYSCGEIVTVEPALLDGGVVGEEN